MRPQPTSRQHPATSAVAAPCEVTNRWLGFHRIWHGSGEVFDTVDLFLPDVQFSSQASQCPLLSLQHISWLSIMSGIVLFMTLRSALSWEQGHLCACCS